MDGHNDYIFNMGAFDGDVYLAAGNGKCHIVDGDDIAEPLGDMSNVDDRGLHRRNMGRTRPIR